MYIYGLLVAFNLYMLQAVVFTMALITCFLMVKPEEQHQEEMRRLPELAVAV